jgi:hydroxymethylglutaryl-CoA lyase
MKLPSNVKIVEVGPRDGLQNESRVVPLEIKVELIDRLTATGLVMIEAGAFVSPKWVPQMADTAQVFAGIYRHPSKTYPVLVPNMKGLEAALGAGVTEIAVFVSASEGFSLKNIACTRAESIDRLWPVAEKALSAGLRVRGYVSCIAGCPYDGDVPPADVVRMVKALHDIGCYEVSLGDTIGVGTAGQIRAIIGAVAGSVPRKKLAMHFHDTYGQGVANILASLEEGVSVFDSSVGGLGGCPYAPGASGNVATEDVLYLLHGLGIETGVDFAAVARIGAWISGQLSRANASRAGRAYLAKLGDGNG